MNNTLLTKERLLEEDPSDFIYIGKPEIIYELKRIHNIFLIEVNAESVPYTPSSYATNIKNEVTHLNLSRNYISSTKGLEPFVHLSFLDLSINNLTDIKHLQTLINLQELDLSCNNISNIQGLDNLVELYFLDLSGNCISTIEELHNLTHLEYLFIDSNNIVIPHGVLNLPNLKTFVADRNLHTDLNKSEHEYIQNNATDKSSTKVKLQDKTFINNKLEPDYFIYENKPSDVVFLKDLYNIILLEVKDDQVYTKRNSYKLNSNQKITHLNLSYNHINKIKGLSALTDLVFLDLSTNDLTEIEGIESLIQLNKLNLSNNYINQIKGLESLTQLEELNLSNLHISQIEGLSSLSQLRILDLSSNDIQKIDGLESLKQLEELYLFDNDIDLPELIKIKNIISQETFKILQFHNSSENHLDFILKYFSDTEVRTDIIEMVLPVKVMLLGNHSAGKTTFYHYLRDHKIPESCTSTHILNIHQYPKINNDTFYNNELQKAIIFDFGGQDYYHGLYQAFFSEDSINLIFWYEKANSNNIRIANDNTHCCTRNFSREYWLFQIKYAIRRRKEQTGMSGNPTDPIFLIETHADLIDCHHNLPVIFSDLSIKKEYCISLNKKKIENNKIFRRELDRLIEDLLSEIELKSQIVNKLDYYKEFLSYVLSYEHPTWLSIKEDIFDKGLYKRNKINNETDDQILTFLKVDLYELHNKGLVLYYKGNDKLDNVVWLNPTKTVEFIHNKILSKNIIINNKGIIEKDEFDGICNDDKIHELLLSEKIVFYDIHSLKYIVPSYLQLSIEDVNYNKLNRDFKSIKPNYILRFNDFIPFGLINQLICLYGNFPKQKCFWRDEVNFEFEYYTVYIKLVFSQLSILVYIKPIQGESTKLTLKEVERAIFLNIIDLYYTREVYYDYDINTFAEDVRKYILLKERKDKFESPQDMYISIDGELFINHAAMENIITPQKAIRAYDLKNTSAMAENNVPVKVINDACNKTTEISSYRNFSNNKMVKKMKKIFISFSRKDVDFKNELKKHLSILNLFEISDNWSCEEIAIGTWDNQIQTELENSDLIIYMLSANFFSSSYIVKKELNIINNENPNKHFLCVRVSEFANLDNIEESVSATHNISDIQKSILRLRDYQHLPYTTKFNMVSKQNEEMLSSLKTFSNENKIEDALKQVVDHIQRLFLK